MNRVLEKCVLRQIFLEWTQKVRHERPPSGTVPHRQIARRWTRQRFASTLLLLFFLAVVMLPACSKPETSKALVKISNVKVTRTGEHALKVTLDYDLEPGVRLPLPYTEVLVSPLEPKVKLAGTL